MNQPTQADIDRYLDEDTYAAGEYKYVAISFCASRTRQKLENHDGKIALKIRGAFKSIDDGVAHIKDLHTNKESFDTYLCDMGKWTLLGNIQDIDNPEAHLVDMIRVVHEKNTEHRKAFEERRDRTKEHGLSEEDLKEAMLAAPEEATKQEKTLADITPLSCNDQSGENDSSFSRVDTVKVPDVNVVIVSYVESDPERRDLETPEGCIGVKFRGAFSSKKDAEEHLDKVLSKIERDVDMFVVDCYKWLLVPPHVDDIKDVRYREDYLQEMFTSYEESQRAAKLHHIEREKMTPMDIMENDPTHPVEIEESQVGEAS